MLLNTYHQAMQKYADFKRFNERWVSDPNFRKALAADKVGTLTKYNIHCHPDDVHSLQDIQPNQPGPPSAAMKAIWEVVLAKSTFVGEFYKKEGQPKDPRFKAWRERQIARQWLEIGPFPTKSNIHASLSIELTKGCSVGCWFCALSPEQLSGVFSYTDTNRVLWRDVLNVLNDHLGPAAKTGFLYWATDPLDNPDYERWCLDYHEIVGIFPPTTTAKAGEDPERTRALLELSQSRDCWLNRFSIISLKMLDHVHAEFSAQELAQVECLPLNREGAFVYGNAGRFRERAQKDPKLMEQQRKSLLWAPWFTADPSYADCDDYPMSSIGCVTGFLINMVDRSVQLIAPCASSDRWPLGYFIFDRGHFADGNELAQWIDRTMDERMWPILRGGDRLRFHHWLELEPLEDGFQLNGRFKQRLAFRGPERSNQWKAIGDLVAQGDRTTEDIVETVSVQQNINREVVYSMLNSLFCTGVIDELDLPSC
ncbi:radical SAM family RiPP maturation amino acid epimerase [Coleofasciculus sp.]|uniref:radical SAM family RiPP maturation amino acid epimerase n=1 Tax=Coleofasciculus sp. TaxID=3100458 RepID=UPI0039FACF63